MTKSNVAAVVLFVNHRVLLKKRSFGKEPCPDASCGSRKLCAACCDIARLDDRPAAAHLPAMSCRPSLLAGMRGSLLGTWLACAYGLAVLAGALAPASAASHGPLRDAVLCSGLAAPGQDAPADVGEPSHCKGCPVNPLLAVPACAAALVAARTALLLALPEPDIAAAPSRGRFGLPQSRGPPRA